MSEPETPGRARPVVLHGPWIDLDAEVTYRVALNGNGVPIIQYLYGEGDIQGWDTAEDLEGAVAAAELASVAAERDRYKALAGQQRVLIGQLCEWALGCDDPSRFRKCDNFSEISPKTIFRMVPASGLMILWEDVAPIMDVMEDADGQRAAEQLATLVGFRALFEQAALALGCLPSQFPDGNGHVLEKAATLKARFARLGGLLASIGPPEEFRLAVYAGGEYLGNAWRWFRDQVREAEGAQP